jgi:hypothetical protein
VHVVVVDLAGRESGADRRGHDDVPADRRLDVVARWLHQARHHEGAHRPDVRRQVVRGRVDEVVEKAGADQRAEGRPSTSARMAVRG